MLICPVCGTELQKVDRTLRCENNHSFDVAKEGYVNLLRASKNGDLIGDDKLSARSRRDFLNKGYYIPQNDPPHKADWPVPQQKVELSTASANHNPGQVSLLNQSQSFPSRSRLTWGS